MMRAHAKPHGVSALLKIVQALASLGVRPPPELVGALCTGERTCMQSCVCVCVCMSLACGATDCCGFTTPVAHAASGYSCLR